MKKIFLSIFLLTLVSLGYAQTFSVELGPAIPLGDFAKDDISDEDEFGAGLGFNLGVNFAMPINASGLELFGETGILYTRQKKDYRDDLEDLFEASYGDDIDITYSKYIGIPLIAGVQYVQSPTEGAGFFAKAGLGLGFLKPTTLLVEDDGYDLTYSYDMSTGLALTIGGGVILNDQLTIGLKYLGLGNREFDGEIKVDYDAPGQASEKSKIKDLEVNPGTMTIFAGWRF